ncbi:unnamed protein product, partial [Mesorhabditis spiculigera]
MPDTVDLFITTNVNQHPLEKKYPLLLTTGELKHKLELVVGAAAADIQLELFDAQGKSSGAMTNPAASLQEYGISNGYRVHATDLTGQNATLETGDASYTLSDDAYAQRTDSVRAFKQRMLAEKLEGNAKTHEETPVDFSVGDRCEVRLPGNMPRRGNVAFIGAVEFAPGTWVGIKYDDAVGKNNGSVQGVKYFTCADNHGGFVRPDAVKVGVFPQQSGEIEEF